MADFREAFPNLSFADAADLIAEGDYAVGRWVGGGTHAVPAYVLASYVAMSRLHDNVHFLSDVTAGAAVGIIASRTVTRHGRENFMVSLMAVPAGVGFIYVSNGTN